jgi:hypothetical protein
VLVISSPSAKLQGKLCEKSFLFSGYCGDFYLKDYSLKQRLFFFFRVCYWPQEQQYQARFKVGTSILEGSKYVEH